MSPHRSLINILDFVIPRKMIMMALIAAGKHPPPWRKEHEGPDWSIWRDCLRVSTHYLEYGAGESTIHVAKTYQCTVRSVETDPGWSRFVQDKSVGKAEIVLVDLGPVAKLGSPVDYARRHDFERYCEAGFETGFSPDLVLVDGRFRIAVFLTALLRTKPGTLIVFDDYIKRPKYHVIEEIICPVKVGRRQALFERPSSVNFRQILQMRRDFMMVMD